jgi:NDP-sugar pyrophosphorylase family protein
VLEQCVILLGGLGTRLGDLAKALPKPLLPVGESPFVEVLISEARRRGFRKYLLLAGHRAEVVSDYLYANDVRNRFGATIELSIESTPLGTGGALVHALDRLDDEFLLLNGDTWFDFNWMDFVARSRVEGRSGGVALRSVVSPDRYETVELDGVQVSTIRPRGSSLEPAFINGGVYHLKRRSLEGLHQPSSLEADLLPHLIREGQLSGFAYSGFFIDIGTPESYAAA